MGVLTDVSPTKPAADETQQYLRHITLVVYGTDLSENGQNGIDLSNLRIKASIKKSDTMTPNVADIRVYNVSQETALSMLLNLSPVQNGVLQKDAGKVILQGGYDNNFGVIFKGNIKQIILGRESATDTFVDIVAGDGERAYNYAVVNATIAAGATQDDQLKAVTTSTTPQGVTLGYVGNKGTSAKLPRGKVMFGNAKNYLRDIAKNTDQTWSIQDEQLDLVPVGGYVKGTQVILTSKTGLVGTPQQTTQGVNIKCLLNPFIKVNGLVNIDEASVADYKINLGTPNSPANIPPPLTQDGSYFVMIIEYQLDTRGVEWYCNLTCIAQDITTNPINSVETTYGL